MKKRMLCLLLSAAMMAGGLSGCGTESDSTSGKKTEEATEVSSETSIEDQYVERMEAYLDYFNSEEKDYDGVVGAAITLDSDSLPLLWLAYADSSDRGEDMRFQLCSYQKDKVDILAEKEIDNVDGAYPYLGIEQSGLQLEFDDGDGDDPAALVYNPDEQEFEFYDVDYFDYDNYKNDDIEEYCEKMQNDIDAYRIVNRQRKFLTLNYSGETAYFGMLDSNDIYFSILNNIGALDDSALSEGDYMLGRNLSDDFKDNKFVSEIFDEHFSKDDRGDYYVVKPDFYLPDGTVINEEDAVYKYFDITKEDVTNAGLTLSTTDSNIEFLADMDAKALMRELIKHPAYTSFDILIANAKLYSEDEAANWQFGDLVEVKDILKDAKKFKDNNSVDSTQSAEEVYREESTEESKETNTDVSAWKQAYLDYFDNLDSKIIDSKLIRVKGLDAPVLACSVDDGSVDIELYYVNKAGEVKTLNYYVRNRASCYYNRAEASFVLFGFSDDKDYDTSVEKWQYNKDTDEFEKTVSGWVEDDGNGGYYNIVYFDYSVSEDESRTNNLDEYKDYCQRLKDNNKEAIQLEEVPGDGSSLEDTLNGSR